MHRSLSHRSPTRAAYVWVGRRCHPGRCLSVVGHCCPLTDQTPLNVKALVGVWVVVAIAILIHGQGVLVRTSRGREGERGNREAIRLSRGSCRCSSTGMLEKSDFSIDRCISTHTHHGEVEMVFVDCKSRTRTQRTWTCDSLLYRTMYQPI